MFGIDDLVSGGMAIGGLAASIMGGQKASQASSQIAASSMAIGQSEMQQDALRAQAMELSARRQSMEILRNQQRARAMAQSTATAQGAAYGSSSGLQGAYGGISGQTNTNMLGLNQSLQLGRQMFGLNQQIDQQRINIAGFQGDLASAQGEMQFGSSLMGGATAGGRLANNFLGGSFNSALGGLGKIFGG